MVGIETRREGTSESVGDGNCKAVVQKGTTLP